LADLGSLLRTAVEADDEELLLLLPSVLSFFFFGGSGYSVENYYEFAFSVKFVKLFVFL